VFLLQYFPAETVRVNYITCAGNFGYAFSKQTVNSKVSNSFASCVMERWRVKEYESATGTGILEQMPAGVNTGWLAGGTEGIDSATD
jgi:hypothetical protein